MPKYDAKQVAGVEEGDVFAGKYRIEEVLGAGGMGVVIAAHHLQLDEKVAIKFLLPAALEDTQSVNRFLREARAAVKIKSEHVARVFDVGTLENGAPYMVMEFLEGGDLAGWIQQRGALPVEQAVDFVLQACVAVAEAHRLGIVHRDLKPANLFCVLRADGQLAVKVLDFGISKVLQGAVTDPNNATASLLGSPFYMSPEQMRSSGDLGPGTDIWALGVILYELLSARVPFQGVTITEVATKVISQAPTPLRQRRPDVPAGLEAAVGRCLQKDRRSRFASVAELAAALQKFGSRRAAAYVERIAGTLEGLDATAVSSGNSWDQPPSPRSQDGAPAAAGTIAPMGRTVPRGMGARTGVIAAVLVVGGAAAAAATLWARATHVQIRVASDSGSTPQMPQSTALSTVPVESLPIASAMPPELLLPVASASDRPTSPAAKTRPSSTAVHRNPQPAVSSSPAATASAGDKSAGDKGCRLISFFDAEGNQHFKTTCDGHDGN